MPVCYSCVVCGQVREGGRHGRYVGHFTGSVMPILYGKAFWLRFTSDFSNAKKGFRFSWSGKRIIYLEFAIICPCIILAREVSIQFVS